MKTAKLSLYIAILCISALAVPAHLAGGSQGTITPVGDTKRQEAERATIVGHFLCGTFQGRYRYVATKRGLESLKLSVNGVPIPTERLNDARQEVLEAGGFDLISFSCSRHSYEFFFTKLNSEKPPEIVSVVSGSMP